MGQVYLAEHKVMRRLVALKVLPIRPNADPVLILRFQREARAAAALNHPNIVHAYDADQDEKAHFLVLEYIDGTSLQDLVKRGGPLPVGRAVNYICQAARGLHYAHEAGLIHRDVKPGNILLDRGGGVKILDLGLARIFHDNKDNLTVELNNGLALGTVDYLAPEQAANSHDVDPRADLYALGGSLYYLLTGRVPFQNGTTAEKLIWHRYKKPTPLRELCPEAPAEVEAILNRMMAKQPEERYPTAAVVVEALSPWAGPMATPPEGEIPLPCVAVRNLLEPQAVLEARRAASCAAIPLPPVAPSAMSPLGDHSVSSPFRPALPSRPDGSGEPACTKATTSRPDIFRQPVAVVEMLPCDQHSNIDTELPDLHSLTPPQGSPLPVEAWLPDLTAAPQSKGFAPRWWWPLVIATMIALGSVAGAVWTMTALAGR